jgi:hypothetical protein
MVPGAGLEPARPYGQWFLRPFCLPVPTSRQELQSKRRESPETSSDLGFYTRQMNIRRHLSDVGARLARARDELRIVDEQIVFQSGVVDDAETRAVVAETPLADREYRMARDDLGRLQRQRDRIAAELAELRAEQDRLLDRLLDAHT